MGKLVFQTALDQIEKRDHVLNHVLIGPIGHRGQQMGATRTE